MKAKFLKIINPILLLVVLAQVSTGIGQRYVGQDVFILFRRIHNTLAYVLVVAIIIHIYLNWSWIKTTFFKRRHKK